MAPVARDRSELELLEAYLLGELPEGEAIALEDQYFADDARFEALEAAETSLVDAYAAGELAPERRRRFEERLLATAAQRERLEFARALLARCGVEPAVAREAASAASAANADSAASAASRAAPTAPATSDWWSRLRRWLWPDTGYGRLAWVGSVAVLVFVVVVAVRGPAGPGGRSAGPISVTLVESALRSDSDPRPSVRLAGHGELRLRFDLAADRAAELAQVRLETAASPRLDLTASATAIGARASADVVVPASALRPGIYQITLLDRAGEPIAFYELSVLE